jgi:tRNA(fMet)-specific endonuclease VapC
VSLFLLDTDIVTLMRAGNTEVLIQVAKHGPMTLAASVITVEEQLRGWYTLIRRASNDSQLVAAYERLTNTMGFYSGVQILSYTTGAAAHFAALKASKLRIGKMDLRIACIALDLGAILVTRNISDFKQVPGLRIENWALPNLV